MASNGGSLDWDRAQMMVMGKLKDYGIAIKELGEAQHSANILALERYEFLKSKIEVNKVRICIAFGIATSPGAIALIIKAVWG